MAHESRKLKKRDTLGQVSVRVFRALDVAEAHMANLSLGELINTLFLTHCDGGLTGTFSVSFGAALKMVEREMMWEKCEAKPAAVEPEQWVN